MRLQGETRASGFTKSVALQDATRSNSGHGRILPCVSENAGKAGWPLLPTLVHWTTLYEVVTQNCALLTARKASSRDLRARGMTDHGCSGTSRSASRRLPQHSPTTTNTSRRVQDDRRLLQFRYEILNYTKIQIIQNINLFYAMFFKFDSFLPYQLGDLALAFC